MTSALGGGSVAIDGEVEVSTTENGEGAVISTRKPAPGTNIGDDDLSRSSRRSRRRRGLGRSSTSDYTSDDDLSTSRGNGRRKGGKSPAKGLRRTISRSISFATRGKRANQILKVTEEEERELSAMESMPWYLLCEIFDYLNPRECYYVRGVCRNFRKLAAQGCSKMIFAEGAPFGGTNITITSVDFYGHYVAKGDPRAEEMDISRRGPHKKNWGRSRRYSSARHEYVQELRMQQARHVQNIRRSIHSAFQPLVLDVVEKKAQRSREAMAITDLERLNAFEIGEMIEVEELICCGAAVRHGRSNTRGDKTALCLQSLDIERSTFLAKSKYIGYQPTLSQMCDKKIYKDFPLKYHLLKLDLSGLIDLQRVSLRGCVNLEELRLPIDLMRLDTTSCAKLRRITMPLGKSQKGITALNFHGCRGLDSCAPFTEATTKRRALTKLKSIRKSITVDQTNVHVTGYNPDSECIFGPDRSQSVFVCTRQLDFTACQTLPDFIIVDAFRNCSSLVSVSLRFVATNKILFALAGSTAAGTTLRLVDVAFSKDLKDAAVLRVLGAAPRLIRMDMKKCVTITPKTYNQILRVCRKREKLALEALSGSSIEERLDLFI